jgi:hypothetical protein
LINRLLSALQKGPIGDCEEVFNPPPRKASLYHVKAKIWGGPEKKIRIIWMERRFQREALHSISAEGNSQVIKTFLQ